MIRKRGETWKQALAYHAYAWGSRAARALPARLEEPAARIGGALFHRLAPGARARVEANLARVLGADPGAPLVREATRDAFTSYVRYWVETFRLPVMTDDHFLGRHDVVGAEHIRAARGGGRGVVMALPHIGNWDAAARWVTTERIPMTAVAEELEPPRLARLFEEHRHAIGMGIVLLSAGSRVGDELVKLLAENQMLCLVADRDLTGRGVDVEMFGARTQLPAGPAMLSLSTGAPLLPSMTRFDEQGRWLTVIQPALEIERTGSFRDDVTRLTRLLAAEFERAISATPLDWHMFQPYWPAR